MDAATLLRVAQQLPKDRGADQPRIAAIQHAVAVLRAFSAAEPLLGVNEIARRVGLHKSTVSRILATLEDAHLVERDAASGRFSLGPGVVALAGPLLANLNVREVAQPYLQQLAQDTGESVSLSIWNHGEAVNVDQVFGPGLIQHIAPIGSRSPAHCTATGKTFLAYAPPGEVQAILARGFTRFTNRTITDARTLQAELDQIRALGYALNDRELADNLIATAAPIRDHRGQVVAAVGVSAPAFDNIQERLERFAGLTMTTAASISRRLGYAGQVEPDFLSRTSPPGPLSRKQERGRESG
jgi:DNA-binding IclR family transcriptional regulator